MPTFALLLAASLALSAQTPSPSSPIDELAAARAEARGRYQKVEAELARARLERLMPEQRAARAKLLEVLEAYVLRADFGVQEREPDARLPQFVDDAGRRCAIAELLHATGEDALVSSVAAANNAAWIADLSEDSNFLAWLDRHGLTLEEAARIQGPAMPRFPPEPPPVYNGPGDVRPSAPSSPATPGTGAPSGPGRPMPSGGAGPVPTGAGPTTPQGAPSLPGVVFTESDSSWWQWWEFNKVEFLRPNRFELASTASDDVGRTFASQLDFMRRALLPSLVRALEHPDARIRASAAGALGRMGGSEAVEHLLPLLVDSNQLVRDAALLGLGATGAREAQPVLARIAEEGKLGNAREFGRRGRALAVVALALGRGIGFDESADDTVVKLVTNCLPVEQAELGVAAMTYALLNPSDKLTALAAELAGAKGQPLAVRCRAAEALRGRSDSATLSALQHMASGARVELRRSAALTLGEFEHPLAVAGLMTAHDLEKEPVASSYLLVSLGRRGGEKAREHLTAALRSGSSAERPWAALGLGILARETGDVLAVQALREALPNESNTESRCAYWLGLGLSGAPEALETLATALSASSDSRARMYAAQALAMLGSEDARRALLARLEVERSPLARSQIALALGVIGARDDLDEIVATLDSVAEPALQGQVAAALAFHGSGDALAQLGSLVASEKLDVAARAAAIDGLGMLLSRGPALTLARSSRSANFPLFPEWLLECYGTTF